MAEQQQYREIDKFDRIMGSMDGRPDVTKAAATTIRLSSPLVGAQTFIVQTYRERERGDTVFIEYAASEGLIRIALPPQVANAIVRQRESLGTKVRKQHGKRIAAERKARGEQPAFLKMKRQSKAN